MAQESEIQKKEKQEKQEIETLVRILGYDIPGSKRVYIGLIRIKGVSWSISNAVCLKLRIPLTKKISDLSKDDIHQIESFIKEMPLPDFLKNRRYDQETGETKHYYGTDLDMKKEFDIKRLIKIKSYKGIRHVAGQPVRGQRTRSHFRNRANKRTVGIKRKKK